MQTVGKERPVICVDGTNRDIILSAELVLEAFDTGLRTHQVALLPYVLKQALNREYQNVARLADLTPRGRQDIAWAMFWSIACAEAQPLEPPTLEGRTALAASITSFSGVQAAKDICHTDSVKSLHLFLRINCVQQCRKPVRCWCQRQERNP